MAYAAFAKVDPRLLAQDFGADKSEVIKAAGSLVGEVGDAAATIIKANADAEAARETELNQIGENIVNENQRLQQWTDNGNLPEDFETIPGYTVRDGQVVYENQIRQMALGLKGKEGRQFRRDQRRVNRGKKARTKLGSKYFDDEGQVVDEQGNILTDKLERKQEERVYSDYEQKIFETNPDYNPNETRRLPSKEDTARYANDSQVEETLFATLRDQVNSLRLSPKNNERLSGFIAAIGRENGVQRMFNGRTGGWDYVWTDNKGKVQTMPVQFLQQNQVKAFGPPQSDVTANTIAGDIKLNINSVRHITPTEHAQIKSNVIEAFGDEGKRQRYISQYGIDALDVNKDGEVSNDELFDHWETVYKGLNAFYGKSLTTEAPVKPPSKAETTVAAVSARFDRAVQSQDATSLHGITIGGDTIGSGATIKGTILTNRTSVKPSNIEGMVETQGSVKVEFADGTRATITKKNIGDYTEKLAEEGNSVTVLKEYNLNDPNIKQNIIEQHISTLPTEDQKGTQPYISVTRGSVYRTQQVAVSEDGTESRIVLSNNNVSVGAPAGDVEDGVYTVNIDGDETKITVSDGVITRSDIVEQKLSPIQKVMEYPKQPEKWKGISISYKGPRGYNFSGSLDSEAGVTKLYQFFKVGLGGYKDKQGNKGITKRRQLHEHLLKDKKIGKAYRAFLETGKINPDLLR